MTMTIHIQNHDALNAAFAEKVIGYSDPITVYAWSDRKAKKRPIIRYRTKANVGRYELGDYSCYATEHGDKIWCGKPYPIYAAPTDYTRSMDAVLVHLGRVWDCEANPEGFAVRVYTDEGMAKAFAPTLPHAAVVALLRAKGVTITEETHHD